jgi:hypothetical protein
MKVSQLEVGDEIQLNRECVVIVREVSETGVQVSKEFGTGLFSIPRYSHQYDDLENRVNLKLPERLKV